MERREIPIVESKRAISLNQVRKLSFFTSKSAESFLFAMKDLVKDKKYLAWINDPELFRIMNPELTAIFDS